MLVGTLRAMALSAAVAALAFLHCGAMAGAPAEPRRAALCSVGHFAPWISQFIDPALKGKLRDRGYEVGHLEYRAVTPEALRPFNVLILQWAPTAGDTAGSKTYLQKLPIIEDYVRSGGGILVTCENAYDAFRNINQLLKRFDAEVLVESLVDPTHTFRQKRYLQYYFCSTENLDGAHPVTRGVPRLIVPLNHSLGGGGTLPLRVRPPWQVIVRGAPTAKSAKGTYPSAPPLVAVRPFGAGRVGLFPTHTTYWVNAGYHQIWEGICLDQGNGFQLLDNFCRWLAEPSLASGKLGGFREAKPEPAKPAPPATEGVASTDVYTRLIAAGARKPVTEIRHERKKLRDFVGVVGVRTATSCVKPNSYGGGVGSVADYCRRARARGDSFIVFTELLEAMDATKWAKLVADCKAQTDKDFIAIPGLAYPNGWGDQFIAFDLPHWPRKKWLSDDGKKV
ncbi:hypothetical protein HQ576_07880, partial [bacterium]|nr:hypothetical protein [bacterium]